MTAGRARPGYRAKITPLGSNRVLKGTVDSVAAGNECQQYQRIPAGYGDDDFTSNGCVPAQRVPVRIRPRYSREFQACRYDGNRRDHRCWCDRVTCRDLPPPAAELSQSSWAFSPLPTATCSFAVKLACAIVLALFIGFHFHRRRRVGRC